MSSRKKSTEIQKRIDRTAGRRQNMNGAGLGGQLVTKRIRDASGRAIGTAPGKSELGNRLQRYNDIRVALGLSAI